MAVATLAGKRHLEWSNPGWWDKPSLSDFGTSGIRLHRIRREERGRFGEWNGVLLKNAVDHVSFFLDTGQSLVESLVLERQFLVINS